jgi:putative ABC transport system permease protein
MPDWKDEITKRLEKLKLAPAREADIAEELAQHLDDRYRELMAGGNSEGEARRMAIEELKDEDLLASGLSKVERETPEEPIILGTDRGHKFLSSLWQDIRYGLRQFRRNAAFTGVAVLTLALGIGANAAIFTLTYAVILKRLPVPDASQLVRYTFRNGSQDLGLSGPLYDALDKQESVLQGLLAWSGAQFAVKENGVLRSLDGALMTGNGFRVLKLGPALGRAFDETDDVTGGGPDGYQALLGYSYWRQHFHGATSILGQSLTINGKPVTIVGVLPKGFQGLVEGQRTNILLPLAFEEVLNAPHPQRHNPGNFWLTVMGRLKAGQTVQSAMADLGATDRAVRDGADPRHIFLRGFFAPFKLGVESGSSGRSFLRVMYERPLLVLELMVTLLLILCCVNVALLMLVRVSSRQQEFAVRVALGASRARMFRQILSEVALLAACGLVAGLFIGWWAAQSLVAMLASVGQSPSIDVTPRAVILAFTASVTIFSALTASMWPALRASRLPLQPSLNQGRGSSTLKHLGGWFVPAQVAVSVLLLAGASVLGGALFHLLFADSGFRPADVAMADIDLSAGKPTSREASREAEQILEQVRSAPGVQAAALMDMPPLRSFWSAAHYFSVDKRGNVHSDMNAWLEGASPGYFATMGTTITLGRAFSHQDLGGTPLCVVSSSAANYFFPREDAIGKFIYAGGNDPSLDGKTKVINIDTCAVIGVAQDARFRTLRELPPRIIYRLFSPSEPGTMFSIAARGRNSAVGASAIRSAIHDVAPLAVQPTVYTFNELIKEDLRTERMLTALSSFFAAVALLLTALGLYGLLARSIALRTKEIGIRTALGGRPRDILGMVIWQGLRLVLIGVAFGLALSFAAHRVLGGLLFGVKATNPIILVGVVGVLLLTALPACYIPARRATKVDPMVALRHE